MNLIQTIKGQKEKYKKRRQLYKQLKDAPEEELLKAIDTDPESYNIVIKVLHKRAETFDSDARGDISTGHACLLRIRRESKEFKDLESTVSKCFSAIIAKAPEYEDMIAKFNKGFILPLEISTNRTASPELQTYCSSGISPLIRER